MKGLLSVSFGTSYAETRVKTIDAIDARLAAAFPDRAFYSAWTSPRIMAKVLAERGEQHDSLDEAFGRNVCSLDDKPTNGEFIALVSDRLRIKESA